VHPRKRIRHTAVNILKTGVDVGKRVYAQRPDAIQEEEYPLVCVYFTNDRVDAVNNSQSIYDRTLQLQVEIIHCVRENIDDILDDLSWQSTQSLLQDIHWPTRQRPDGEIDNIKLTGETPYNNNLDGEQYRGVTRLTFNIEYDMCITSTSGIDEFKNFGKEINAPIGNDGDAAKIEFNQIIRTD
jgi:hypothetical protein